MKLRGGLVSLLALVIAALGVLAGNADAKVIPGQYIVVLKNGADTGQAVKEARSLGGNVVAQYRHALMGYAAQLSPSQLATVEADRSVLFVAPDREVNAAAKPGPPPQPPQEISNGVRRIGGDESSTVSGDGLGSVPINAAVLDSGIDPTHPDLNVVGGFNCASGGASDWADKYGHGTAVAGFIGALDNAIGRVGVAPGARLWAVRVLGPSGNGTESQAVCGLDWVTGTRLDADPANDIAVANMSLTGDHPADDGNCGLDSKDALHQAVCGAVARGIVPVAAAGNDSEDIAASGNQGTSVAAPAAFDEVLTATAMADKDGAPGGLGGSLTCEPSEVDDAAATFSNFASLPADAAHTVAAPGTCIGSTWLDGQYAVASGTSFASPLVAGTVALCLASGRKPCAGLTPAQIVAKIVADARAYNTTNRNFGYGFTGDPLHSPDPGRYYGYLIRAGEY